MIDFKSTSYPTMSIAKEFKIPLDVAYCYMGGLMGHAPFYWFDWAANRVIDLLKGTGQYHVFHNTCVAWVDMWRKQQYPDKTPAEGAKA